MNSTAYSLNSTSDREDFDLWIEAGHTEKHYWADLWRYRELFYILAWRDVAVRYKQTVAGAAWAMRPRKPATEKPLEPGAANRAR